MARSFAASALAIISFCLVLAQSRVAQAPIPTPSPIASPVAKPRYRPCPDANKTSSLEKQFFKNILKDQCVIWTSPSRLTGADAKWLIPLGAATAGLVASDEFTASKLSSGGSLPGFSEKVSYGGTFWATGGVAAAFYIAGRAGHNVRARETGVLAAEALLNSGVVTQVLKLATQRPRPTVGDGSGQFFTGGNSFPSGHSSSAWSVATVIAYEYKCNTAVRFTAYAAATAVSLSRFGARKHFLSDILVGSAIGFYTGRYVYRAHSENTNESCGASNASPTSKTNSKLAPMILPLYDPRSKTYGGRFVWTL
ncbi:MAG: hypothetical protein DMF62_17290 [Acidobacteria bacterium]|nr:MAG: hypothetical protein DMF62_17290 [Acidobacteriota bacterium]